jgi:hypothetical protein
VGIDVGTSLAYVGRLTRVRTGVGPGVGTWCWPSVGTSAGRVGVGPGVRLLVLWCWCWFTGARLLAWVLVLMLPLAGPLTGQPREGAEPVCSRCSHSLRINTSHGITGDLQLVLAHFIQYSARGLPGMYRIARTVLGMSRNPPSGQMSVVRDHMAGLLIRAGVGPGLPGVYWRTQQRRCLL